MVCANAQKFTISIAQIIIRFKSNDEFGGSFYTSDTINRKSVGGQVIDLIFSTRFSRSPVKYFTFVKSIAGKKRERDPVKVHEQEIESAYLEILEEPRSDFTRRQRSPRSGAIWRNRWATLVSTCMDGTMA